MVWISKKSKAQMRARRKKKEKYISKDGGGGNESSTLKRKRTEEESHPDTGRNDGAVTVTIPSNLSGKEIKKLRKEARREARREGRDESKIIFVNENGSSLAVDKKPGIQEESMELESKEPFQKKQRKPRKTYPRINELLEEVENAKKIQERKEKQQDYEESIPSEIKARYVALDCEMVGIGTDGKQSALARVSITKWDGSVVLDTFVKVPTRVTDFRTFVSGVTAKDIRSTNEDAMELHACRKKVGELIKDKILIGHSLKNDFSALMLDHPKQHIRDTAKYKPFMRASGRNGGKLRPRKLRDLVKEHVGITIQVEGEAHSSVDDAHATMELYKTVRDQWEKEIKLKAGGKLVGGRK